MSKFEEVIKKKTGKSAPELYAEMVTGKKKEPINLIDFLEEEGLDSKEILSEVIGTDGRLVDGPITHIKDMDGNIYFIGNEHDWEDARQVLDMGGRLFTMPGNEIKTLAEGPQKRIVQLKHYEKSNVIAKRVKQEVSKVDMKKLLYKSLEKGGYIHTGKGIFERFGIVYRVHLMYSTNDNSSVLKDILDNPGSNMLLVYPHPGWVDHLEGNYAITGKDKWSNQQLIKKGAIVIGEFGHGDGTVHLNTITSNGTLQCLHGAVYNGTKYYNQVQIINKGRSNEPIFADVDDRKLNLNGKYAGPYNFKYIMVG